MIVHSFQLGPMQVGAIEAANKNYSDEFFQKKISSLEIQISKKFKHPLRKREFLAGRALLHFLEPKLPPVLSSETGMPIWDKAYSGSVSHKNGWVIACVASSEKIRSVGIDLEEIESFPLDIAKIICVPEEIEFLNSLENKKDFLALLFSLKESLFKCLYPLSQIWFGFQDAKIISCDFTKCVFEIQLLKNLSSDFKSGHIFVGSFKEEIWNERRFFITALHI